jgi:hypothetical protein
MSNTRFQRSKIKAERAKRHEKNNDHWRRERAKWKLRFRAKGLDRDERETLT